MNEEMFDQYTRTLSQATSRREFVRLTAGLITYAILSRIPSSGKISTLAQSPGCYVNCSGVNSGGNCDSNLVKVENPESPPVANGCGAKGGKKFPERFYEADFKSSCDSHDICYGSCDKTKTSCDNIFLDDLYNECEFVLSGNSPIAERLCYAAAATYYFAVDKFGEDAWVSGQQDSCTCCDPNENSCGPGCTQCIDGGCVSGCSFGSGCTQCIDGGCVSGCPDGQICCDDECVDDCGGCDACPPGQHCSNGFCCSLCSVGDPINGGCVSLCDPFTEQCCGGTCWAFGCCDDGNGGKICCPAGCTCCGTGVGGGRQTKCDGTGVPCGGSCGG